MSKHFSVVFLTPRSQGKFYWGWHMRRKILRYKNIDISLYKIEKTSIYIINAFLNLSVLTIGSSKSWPLRLKGRFSSLGKRLCKAFLSSFIILHHNFLSLFDIIALKSDLLLVWPFLYRHDWQTYQSDLRICCTMHPKVLR